MLFQKKPLTIYEQVKRGKFTAEDGTYELSVLRGETALAPVSTQDLDVAIHEFFAREPFAINHIESYFTRHRAMEAKVHFENWYYDFAGSDVPMLGLSVLLMRDSREMEAVKFGLYLTEFIDIANLPNPLQMVQTLGAHPAFSYYALETLLRSSKSTSAFYELGHSLTGNGKEIYTIMAEELLKGRK